MTKIELDGRSLDLTVFQAIVTGRSPCGLSADAVQRVKASRRTIDEALARGQPVYGVNTGFGDLASVAIAPENLELLQERLILSHSAGLGEPLGDNVVRAMLLLRANTLVKGILAYGSTSSRRCCPC